MGETQCHPRLKISKRQRKREKKAFFVQFTATLKVQRILKSRKRRFLIAKVQTKIYNK
jgi:hypothetical protein